MDSYIKTTVLLSSSCHNKIPQTRWLKQQIFIFSRFWRLEVSDQGAQGLVFGETSFPSLQTAAFILCPHMAFPLYKWKARQLSGVLSSSYKEEAAIPDRRVL